MTNNPVLVKCTVPYNPHLSKNARIGQGRKTRFFIKADAFKAEKQLEVDLKKAVGAVKFYQNKVYLEIYVWKPRNNIDAINFMDIIADVVKKVIGVDDRWYSVKGIDWELDPVNPRIEIKLYQPNRKSIKICSKCLSEFPATKTHFNVSKQHSDGLNTRCKTCIRDLSRDRMKTKRELKNV